MSIVDDMERWDMRATPRPWTNINPIYNSPVASIRAPHLPGRRHTVFQTNHGNGPGQVGHAWSYEAERDERVTNATLICAMRNSLSAMLEVAKAAEALADVHKRLSEADTTSTFSEHCLCRICLAVEELRKVQPL